MEKRQLMAWVTKRWLWVAIPLLLWGLAASWQQWGRDQERAAQSASKLQAAQDSLRVLEDSLHGLGQRVGATLGRVDTLWRVRTVTVVLADEAGRRADSLIQLADTAGPGCPLLQQAYQARTSECLQLRVALQADSQAIAGSQATLRDVRAGLISAQDETRALRLQLADVRRPYQCRLVWFVPCPSRTTAAIAGAVGGFLLAREVFP